MNLWILTEERPKLKVLQAILQKFAKDRNLGVFVDNLRILPILDVKNNFSFTYELIGFKCSKIEKIYLKTISGFSSFVDFLVFYQKKEPQIRDVPIYAIEETKTDDKESRNTGVFQRCSKFIYVNSFYPKTSKIMLYNLQVAQKEKPTDTNIFGTRLLTTLDIEVLGKKIDNKLLQPFKSIDEVIEFKNNMRRPPKDNIPILIKKNKDNIEISGRLYKADSLSHDPNIGALTIISAVLRKLGWKKDIIITMHGLEQKHVGATNKFIKLANLLNIKLDNLKIPTVKKEKRYWQYDLQGEKLGTIFIHTVVESFTKGYSIFENHAGCEKGYFITANGEPIALEKYKDRTKYKAGDKNQIIFIPDLVLIDFDKSEIINIEGKKYKFKQAIKNLLDFWGK